MAHYLPPHLLPLFAPRAAPQFEPPVSRRRWSGGSRPFGAVSSIYKERFESSDEHATAFERRQAAQQAADARDPAHRRQRLLAEGRALNEVRRSEQLAAWAPKERGLASDPFKTLFVARLAYSVNEESLKAEMERALEGKKNVGDDVGNVKTVVVVKDRDTGKSRGYGFVEFQSADDFKYAYKLMDSKRINGRRIIVDVERGRTVANWKPRRLGGGLGRTRDAKLKKRDRPREAATIAVSGPPEGRARGGASGALHGGSGRRYGEPYDASRRSSSGFRDDRRNVGGRDGRGGASGQDGRGRCEERGYGRMGRFGGSGSNEIPLGSRPRQG